MRASNPEDLWRQQIAKLKMHFRQLKAKDLNFNADRKEQCLSHLQHKLGISKQELTDLMTGL
jgi:hypothetical protein